MNNRYYVMRHGRSKANEAGIIISDPELGTKDWGLTEEGKKQIRKGVAPCSLTSETVIYTSDFLRARESAALAAEILGTLPPTIDIRLRERFFGDYDQQNDSCYKLVWADDEGNGDNRNNLVESPNNVQKRITALVCDLEEKHNNCDILLVSHGDALQITQTFFEAKKAEEHRSLRHLETGEIRKLPDLSS